ncbi:hypothetical protein [Ideonella sp.]|uniref:hypothetical protein n=1 Tax=Ideonella sp. TaxID=1929293 RepID=UPI002B4A2BCC|nr:hypothetical protein [Ideonella sp.]HJV70107.1 hypothetical protein [Ideonella sp.]
MPIFGQAQRLRSLAARVLLAWLLALGVGIADACVVHAAAAQLAAPQVGAHDGAHCPAHAGAAKAQPAPHADKLVCLKVCGEDAAKAASAKQQLDPGTIAWLAPPPAPLWQDAAAADAQREPLAEAARPPSRVPIPIAFLRLTL